MLQGGRGVEDLSQAFEVVRSPAHGHVAAVWGTLRKIGLLSLLGRRPSHRRSLAAALIAAQVPDLRSKSATARGLDRRTAATTLSHVARVEDATAEEL